MTGQSKDAKRRLRVLLVIKGLGHGGAEHLLVDMVAQGDHDSFDYEVAYVLSRYDGLEKALEDSGTTVHGLGAKGDSDLGWTLRFRSLLIKGRYDIVHFHLPYPASLGRLVVRSLPKRLRPRIVYTEHSLWYQVNLLLRSLNRTTVALDDALIVVSESSREALPARLRNRARVIVHGIDLSDSPANVADRPQIRDEVRDELDVPRDCRLVLTVANLRVEKGYDVLLEAARKVLDHDPAVQFVSVGHGDILETLMESHDRLQLGDNFKFLGLRTDVVRLMTAADVFCLPSRFEGLPVTLMEATSVGLPVVASAVGEIPNIFTDESEALLVEPGDPTALAEALLRVLRDDGLRSRLAQASLEQSSRFDVTTAIESVEAIYRSLVS